jgi:glycosyltransferase involved in cell wall biosynthesis
MRISHSHTSEENNGRQFYRFAMGNLLKVGATAGLAVSNKAAESLFGENWEADPRWRVCHIGIDLEPLSRPVDRSKIRAELDIPEHAFVVGHVGRFVALKNHIFILELAEQVCLLNSDARFVLVGDGPLRNAMERKAKNLGISQNIIFTGVRSDVERLMKGVMDVFLLPSFYEGFPLVLLEAQAAGLPCFIADTISSETDIVPRLVTRLSLADSAQRWAEFVVAAEPQPEKVFSPDVMRDFGIEAAVNRLCRVYDAR